MSDNFGKEENKIENAFLSERFMAVIYILMMGAGFVSLPFCIIEQELYVSPYNKDSFAAFTCVGRNFSFEFDDPTGAVRAAAKAGGSGFMQFALIQNGETVMDINRPRARCYRTLAELNGNLCIIDSSRMMQFDEFMEELQRLGVTNAVYMDMGAGWNYSWYRNAADKVVTLFGLPVPWSHNWVVFEK